MICNKIKQENDETLSTQRAPSHEVRGNTSVLHVEKDIKH